MDPPDEPQHHSGSKRRNKWTLGNFFRRKKNIKDGDTSDSSSEVEEKPRSFLGRRRSARKRSEVNRNKDNLKNSAPWSGSANSLGSSEGFGSHSSLTRKDRREIMKARVEATRRHSSSEEDSILTTKSNSLTKYKSDDILAHKKTRNARTERYMKRISRDEESLSHHSLNRSDVEVHHPPPPAPQNWTASVVYRETSPYVRAVSATPSPIVSPRMQHRVFPTYPPVSPHLPRRSYCEPPKSDIIPIGGYRSSSNINLACNTNGLPSPQMYFYPPVKTSYKQSSLPPPPPPPRDPQRKLLMYSGSEPPAFIRSRSDHSLKQTTPEPLAAASQYQYLADKTPRSRRPIHVVPVTQHEPSPECTMPTPPSWLNVPINESNKTTSFIPEKKILPEEKHVEVRIRQQSKTPPPPPVRRYSRQSSVSSVDDQEPTKRQSNNNLEEALNELEAIYQSLRLGDEDLLDRAERRDLPTAHQQFKLDPKCNDNNIQDEVVLRRKNRAPPNRRSGIPDPVTDDMAYRRLNQPIQHNNRDRQSGSYLLISPTLSPVPVQHDPEEPDTTYDDMAYRTIRNANSVRVVETQPPFGIPLTPSPAAPESDYLHAKPTEKYRPTFRPRKTPDVVKDDLAFRNLRKDNGVVVVNDKRKRAVRSLSANLMNLMDGQQDDIEKTQSLTNVPNSLQLLLENTEMNPEQIVYKRPPPSWVERANLLDTTSTETLTQSRANLRSLRNSYLSEDSRPNSIFIPDRNSKVTTINEDDLSPTSCPLDEDKLEELLSALAKEAHDTSERLGRELERLRDGSRSVEELNKSPPTLTQGKKSLSNKNVLTNNSPTHSKINKTTTQTVVEKITSPPVENNIELIPVENVTESTVIITELVNNNVKNIPVSTDTVENIPEITVPVTTTTIVTEIVTDTVEKITELKSELDNSIIDTNNSDYKPVYNVPTEHNNNTQELIPLPRSIFFKPEKIATSSQTSPENSLLHIDINFNNSKKLSLSKENISNINEDYNNNTSSNNTDISYNSKEVIQIKTKNNQSPIQYTSNTNIKIDGSELNENHTVIIPKNEYENNIIDITNDIDIQTEETVKIYLITEQKSDDSKVEENYLKDNNNTILPLAINEIINSQSDNEISSQDEDKKSLIECMSVQLENNDIQVDTTNINNFTNSLELLTPNIQESDMYEYNQDLRRMSSEIAQTLATILEESCDSDTNQLDTATNNIILHERTSVIPDIVFNVEDFSDISTNNKIEDISDTNINNNDDAEQQCESEILPSSTHQENVTSESTGGEILLSDFGLVNFQNQVKTNAACNYNNVTTQHQHGMDFDLIAFIGAVVALVSILTALSLAAR